MRRIDRFSSRRGPRTPAWHRRDADVLVGHGTASPPGQPSRLDSDLADPPADPRERPMVERYLRVGHAWRASCYWIAHTAGSLSSRLCRWTAGQSTYVGTHARWTRG